MGQEYTLDDIRQTQAYLLSEAATIRRYYRVNDTNTSQPREGVVVPLVTQGTNQSSVLGHIQNNSGINKFFELPQELTKKLKPEIKIYKTYILPDGKEYNYLLPMGRYLANENGARTVVDTVVVKSAEFTRLGGNPAEIDTNIKFNLKLYAQNIHTFFDKHREEPNETYDPTPLVSSYVTNTLPHHAAISENTAAMQALAAIGLNQTPEDAIELARLANDVALHQSQLDAITLAASQVGTNGERDVAWIDLIKIDPGQPLNADLDTTLAVVESDTRIKVEIGYAKAVDPPADFNGTPNEWIEWKEVIEGQREVFYLSLKGHQFDFKANGSIGLSIDYIASGTAKQLSPVADLFHDPEAEKAIDILEREIEEHERELELANRNAANGTGGIVESRREHRRAESRRESCIEGIEDEIEELENKIHEYRSRVRLRLLNQLYLDTARTSTTEGQLYSRVFKRQYKPGKQIEEEDNVRQTDIRYVVLSNLNVVSDNETTQESYDRRQIQAVDFDASADDADESITRDQSEDGFRSDMFIFLGDIVDSAIELLVPSGYTERIETQDEYETQILGTLASAVGFLLSFTGANIPAIALIRNFQNTVTRVSEYNPPFANLSPSGTSQDGLNRYYDALSEFGGVLTGTVTYKDPNAVLTGDVITIKISDIPISLDIFRAWWINNYVKSGKKTLPLRDFINALMKFVEREVFAETPLNFGRVEEKINNPQFIVNTIPLSLEQFSTLYPGDNATSNAFREVSINNVSLNRSNDGTPLVLNALHLTTIEVVDSNPWHTSDVPSIEYGETTKGVLKRITFEREDIPGHSEARLFSDRDSVASNIALREKYNSSLELIGNTCFLPGSLFYLNPYPLDVGYTTDRESFARQLGLGGMYRVVNLTSAISFDDGMWNTKVNTKWESFGDGDNGTSDVVNPPPSTLGLCIEAEITWLERKRDIVQTQVSAATTGSFEWADYVDEVARLNRLIVNLHVAAEEN